MAKKFSCTFTGENRGYTVTLNGKNVPQGMVWIVEASSNTIGPTRKDLETQAGIKFGTWVGTTEIKKHPNWRVEEIK